MTHPRPDESRQPSAPTGWFGIDAASVDEQGEPAQHQAPSAGRSTSAEQGSAPQPAKRRGRRAADVEPDAYPDTRPDGGYRGWTAEAAAGVPQPPTPPQAPRASNAWTRASGPTHSTTDAAPVSLVAPPTSSPPVRGYGSGPRASAGAWGAAPSASTVGGWRAAAEGPPGAPAEAPPGAPEATSAAPVQPEAFEQPARLGLEPEASEALEAAPEAPREPPAPSAPRRGRRASSAVPDAEPTRDASAADTATDATHVDDGRSADPDPDLDPALESEREADVAAPVPEPDRPDTAERTSERRRGRRAAAESPSSWRERAVGPLSAGQWVDAGIVGLVAYAGSLVTALLIVALALPSSSRGGPGGMAAHGGFFQMAVQTVNMGFLHDLGLRGVGTILVLYPLIVPAVAVVALRRLSPRLLLAERPATAGLTLIQGFAASVLFTLLATLLASVLPVGGFAAPAVALSALGFAAMIATITLGHAAGTGLLPPSATLALRQTGEHLGALAAVAAVCGFIALAVSGPLFWLFPYLLPAIAGDAVALSHLSALSSWANGASASIFGLMPLGLALLCVLVALAAVVLAGARWRLRVEASGPLPMWALPLSYALVGLASTLVFRWGGIGYANFAVADLVGPALWTFAIFAVVGLLVELSARLLAPRLPSAVLNALGRGLVPARGTGVAHQELSDAEAEVAEDIELRFIDVSRLDEAAQGLGIERRSWSPIADPDRRPDVVVERANAADTRSDDDAADDLDASGYWTGHRSPLPREGMERADADAAEGPDVANPGEANPGEANPGEANPGGWVAVRPPNRGN